MKITEYKIGNVTVRFHGNPPPKEALEKACVRFMKEVENGKRKNEVVSAPRSSIEADRRLEPCCVLS